ncbi:hypothetical protein Moror_16537 [Moniliophthora roreri MCA 2997]|uniref:Arrestin-like N-terminal domain-containing protein n=2 Tax=Moniliophthora roreri TaxID=221103 RepID=V2XDC3_MONRO|nr:hypothetical protein Moror_16537 [Moniliophthora roreri MCA 2997]KAI3616945.1 hypothetical protein WG66_004337 [Moniliophthora roreri]
MDSELNMDPPPSYETQREPLPSPAYSDIPQGLDISLPTDISAGSTSSRCTNFNWKFKTSHMAIDLGPRIWGLSTPAYGLDGTLRFSVELHTSNGHGGDPEISATLQASISSPTIKTTMFLNQNIPEIHREQRRHSFPQTEIRKKEFCVQVPSTVSLNGTQTSTPPSFLRYYYGVSCEIKYFVKVHARGVGILGGDEIKTIPIAYLPKSRPSQLPVSSIPRPLQDHDGQILCPEFDCADHTRTIRLLPRASSPRYEEGIFDNAVFFSLPTPATFTSGHKIPYLFSFNFPSHPHLCALYAHSSIKVTLIKQLIMSPPSQKHHSSINILPIRKNKSRSPTPESPVQLEWRVSAGRPKYQSEYAEGVYILRGWVDAGGMGREGSWTLGDVAKLQYVLRITIYPPEHLLDNLPTFEHDEVVEITTDEYGGEREVWSMGGVPAPAIGLARVLMEEASGYL